ncbi:MAG TPA: PQQ-dependent sugar dehydrogenase [Mycobacteriales bacterium]|nr:PQQ-dependent sugar dehydrogenase [Mycobacteriales bacterium]
MRKTLACTGVLALVALVAAQPAQADLLAPPTDFTYQVLTEDVYDPMVVQVAPDGRVVVGQRDGKIKVWHQNGAFKTAVQLPVNAARECVDCAEKINDDGGIYSMVLDPHFAKNGYVYLWYGRAHTGSPVTNLEEWWLSRVTLKANDTIDKRSEKVLFRAKSWYLDPEGSQAHYGGVLEFLPDGTLVLGTGDDVDPKCDGGYGPRDDTKAQGHFCNGELTAQNPASPWGKLLRFNPDGSYPDGSKKGVRANPYIGKKAVNPYIPDGTNHKMKYFVASKPKHPKPIAYLPYTYALGFKQPWRGAVDPHTGNMFFGEVGPDAQADDAQKGPQAYEEINTVRLGGGQNFGWPRCMGPNLAYHDYDWAKQVDRGPLDCSKMTAPTIYYTGTDGLSWKPLVGLGPKTSEATLYYPPNKGSLALPSRFFDNIILTDWSRNYAYGVPVSKGRLVTDIKQWNLIRPPIPSGTFVGVGRPGLIPKALGNLVTMMAPLDAAVGRDGAYYMVEYGTGYGNNPLSRLSRLLCTGCAPNPAKDFVHTPGVPVVGAAAAFNPAPVTAAPLHPATKASFLQPARLGALALVGLLGLVGLRRRRVTPA